MCPRPPSNSALSVLVGASTAVSRLDNSMVCCPCISAFTSSLSGHTLFKSTKGSSDWLAPSPPAPPRLLRRKLSHVTKAEVRTTKGKPRPRPSPKDKLCDEAEVGFALTLTESLAVELPVADGMLEVVEPGCLISNRLLFEWHRSHSASSALNNRRWKAWPRFIPGRVRAFQFQLSCVALETFAL